MPGMPLYTIHRQLEIKNSYKRDLLPENNRVRHLVPQVMTNCAEEFLHVAGYVPIQKVSWRFLKRWWMPIP